MNYSRGWGDRSLDAQHVICSWTVIVQDLNNNPVSLTFDLTNDDAPITIGLDVQQFSKRDFCIPEPFLTIHHPQDSNPKSLPIYVKGRNSLTKRAYLDLIGLTPTSGALTATVSGLTIRPTTMARRLHRYTHAPLREMVDMLTRTGCDKTAALRICREIHDNCLVCAQTGPPAPTRKISLTHVCRAFNTEIQADFMFVAIRATKYCVIHVVDASTGYSETAMSPQRSVSTMASAVETIWIHRHGTPSSFSADTEFTKGDMKQFLITHNINLNERPVRRDNETGITERKHRTIKHILERLQKDASRSSDAALLSRATFFSNVFCGSSILSSFELARGYKPALLGAHSRTVPHGLIEAYKDQTFRRALHRLMKSKTPRTTPESLLTPGTPIF